MKRGDKRQKFHEALLQMLYPPPPAPREDNQDSVDTFTRNPNSDCVPDDLDEDRGSTASTDADEGEENGPKKLTRAQRKRLRKKKLKEAASRRRKIIGPLLPDTSENGTAEVGGGGVVEEEPQGVRGNAAERDDHARADKPESEERPLGSKQNKLKAEKNGQETGQ
ncbi:unnamed protein product [Coffea canephora]|uniref:Uncharacterized protein n=2 Tax=Coffea TaxID=13442 RepID=A0A068U273_COFCA|nr:uncharacterized protein LOC113698495 [Coffea arabica]CDP02621.1 unnamed protein product [Coffea canephora]